jgi:L-2-hydroxyglutarate oxidase
MINGGVEAGPNAVLAFRREGYSLTDINIPELMEALSFSGLRKFLVSHRQMVAQEVSSSLFVSSFLERLQKMVPAIRKEHLSKGLAGVRAQAMRSDGTLVQDFEIAMNKHSLHLINAPSPGATSSLAIADYVIEQIPF